MEPLVCFSLEGAIWHSLCTHELVLCEQVPHGSVWLAYHLTKPICLQFFKSSFTSLPSCHLWPRHLDSVTVLPLAQMLVACGTGAFSIIARELETLAANKPVRAHYFQCLQATHHVKVINCDLECSLLSLCSNLSETPLRAGDCAWIRPFSVSMTFIQCLFSLQLANVTPSLIPHVLYWTVSLSPHAIAS